MLISSKIKGKKYKKGAEITDICSHYNYVHNEIVIYLPDVLYHSRDCSINQAFTQHVTHELVHKLLMNIESYKATCDWDNLGSEPTVNIEGHFTLKNWFGGMLDKETKIKEVKK